MLNFTNAWHTNFFRSFRIRDVFFAYFILKIFGHFSVLIRRYGIFGSIVVIYKCLAAYFFRKFQKLPLIRTKFDSEINKNLKKIEDQLVDRNVKYYSTLPSTGWSFSEVTRELEKNAAMKHTRWEDGRVSGAVYHGGDDLLQLQSKAYSLNSVANQLHPDVFPAVRKMESEIVSMVLNMYNAPKGAEGTSTSGGTESLLLACLSARQKAYHERGVTKPEIIAPTTIHAGFDKAAYYFNITLIHAPLDPVTYKVDLKAVQRLITKNTILIAGSAPNFPHGIIDDIEGLSKIALKHKIPLHVDACLGSFIVPFLAKAGFPNIPKFDFRVPGVTSISCDTHKYGFAPKGSSIIMYRTNELRQYQYFITAEWTGGLYASPTLAGSRPGALMAGCWATLMAVGHDGYLASCREIVGTAQKIKSFIQGAKPEVSVDYTNNHEKESYPGIPELKIIGDPIASVVSFTSSTISIYELADRMNHKGWHLNALQKPPAIHIAVTRLTIPVVDELLKDLKESVKELADSGTSPGSGDGNTATLYGVAGSVQTVGVADRLAAGFLDCLYKI